MTKASEEFYNSLRDTAPSDMVVEFLPYDDVSRFKMVLWVDDFYYVPFMLEQMRGFKTAEEFWGYVLSGLKDNGYL